MRTIVWLERQPKLPVVAAIVLLIAAVGWTDYVTGSDVAFSVFYFIPIAAAAYFLGTRSGMAVAGLSAIVWLVADVLGGHEYSSTPLGVWNTINRLLSFAILAALLGALRGAYEQQKEQARSDVLTGARNRRHFLEVLDAEIVRSRRFRRPFSVIHFDLDGFKAVNDRWGHVEGDAVLRAVVEATRGALRATDVMARLGGDEFAVLLPETEAEAARHAAATLQSALDEAMQRHEWPVTFSLGVLTCIDPPADADEVVRRADALTYEAKSRGKNTAVFDVVAARLVSVASPEPRAPRPAPDAAEG